MSHRAPSDIEVSRPEGHTKTAFGLAALVAIGVGLLWIVGSEAAEQILTREELRAQRRLGWEFAPMVPVGLLVAAWGLYAANMRKDWQPQGLQAWLGAIAAPLGLLVFFLGTLLICVPDFFRG